MKDYYYILGIKENANPEQIKSAYRKLSLKFHPDKNDGDEFFTSRFKEIQEAYETLSNSDKKSQYDSKRKINPQAQSGTDYSNFLPIIEYFTPSSASFSNGEAITFRWKTINADKVYIQPFGQVNPIGQKSYIINDFKNEKLSFSLIAENTIIGRKEKSVISLKNNTYSELYEHFKKRLNSEKPKYDNTEKSKFTNTTTSIKKSTYAPWFWTFLLLTITGVTLMVLPEENNALPRDQSFLAIFTSLTAIACAFCVFKEYEN